MDSPNGAAERPHDDQYLDENGAAALIGLSTSYLQKLRVRGGGPVFSRPAARAVRYRVGDLLAWMASKAATSTSDCRAA